MTDYPLKDHAKFSRYAGGKSGLILSCPNCGGFSALFFKQPVGGNYEEFLTLIAEKPTFERVGEELADLTLTPSVLVNGHFHSWIKEGQLCVDSEFQCEKGKA